MGKRFFLLGVILSLVSACDTDGKATGQGTAAQAEADEKQVSLAGKSWQWVSLVTPAETIKVSQPTRYTLGFQADGKLTIRADCNRAFGGYEREDGRIRLRIGGMTKAMCPPGSLSERFVKELDVAATYRFEGDALYLDLKNDAGTMKFRPSIEP